MCKWRFVKVPRVPEVEHQEKQEVLEEAQCKASCLKYWKRLTFISHFVRNVVVKHVVNLLHSCVQIFNFNP